MDQELLTPLNQLETSLNSLLTSLTNTNTYAAGPAATQSLLDADDALSSALTQLKQHQENYARILTLRAEADRLQTQLKDIIRTCVDLRSEIGQIHPSILDDTDDEDEDEDEDEEETSRTTKTSPVSLKRKTNPVDSSTLLSFAARIGKHNAAASLEAERQSNKRDAEPEPNIKPEDTNGNTNTNAAQPSDSAIADDPTGPNNATQESLAELAAIKDTLAAQRAFRGMAFPAAEALRMGVLGRLQYIREQEGEEAVEREIERMVRESEKVSGEIQLQSSKKEVEDVKMESGPLNVERPAAYASQQSLRPAPPQAQLPPKPKVALDLDFPGSDEDDDDD